MMLVAVLCALFTGQAWADDTYEKVTSSSQVTAGSQIIIVCEDNSTAMTATTTNYPGADVTISSSTITLGVSSTVCVLTVGGTAGAYTLTYDTNKQLSWKKNGFQANSTDTNNNLWSISANGALTSNSTNSDASTRKTVRHNTSNTDKFGCYTTSTGAATCLYVKQEAVTNYAITKSASNGTISTQVSSSEVTEAAEDATVTITATPITGYSFSSWSVTKTVGGAAVSVADASANPTTFTMPAEAVTVAATFTINTHDLDLTTDNGTCAVTVDGDDWDGSSAIAYGAAVEITATPFSGFLFDAWDHTLTSPTISSNVISFSMPDEDVIIEAKYVDASSYYSITVDDDIVGGTISADKNTAAEDATITLTATPSTGYSFSAWTVLDEGDNAVTVSNNQFTMPASDVTVTATFTPIAVTGVSLNKTSTSISVGETETLTATVVPANALNTAVTWTSSNTDVATVANGVVTAEAAGSATITVTTTDGSFTATCAVTVVNAVTFDATSDTGTSPLSKNGVSFACSSGVLNNSSEYRLYKNSETTISVETGKITKVEFTGVSGNPASGFASQDGWETDGNDGTWTGSAASVTFTASGAQVRATKIKVYVATTAAPTFSVAAGEYSEAKSVELSCATDGATIYYTTDGTDPDDNSDEYTGAISITETTTLKAIAIKSGVESDVATATYTMNRPVAPAFDVAEGVFDEAFDLHLSTETADATIYYTTNGSTPTTGSSEYSTKVAISAATTTVKAIAVKNGLTSDVSSATYTYDSRTTPTFTLSTTSLDLKVNETSSAVSLTTNSDGDVTFTCADAHVTLTGTGNSRTISANAAGEYTVNVSVTGSATYKDAAGSITVTVTKKATTMVLTPSFTSKDLYITKSGSLTGTPQYNSSNIDGAEVTYSSSDETVATIAADGEVTFKKAGSTTITVSYEGNDEYVECEATYVLDLVDTTPQATEISITLNNTFFGISAITSWKTGDPTSATGESKNVSVTYTKGSSQYFYCNASQIRCYSGNTLSFTAPSGYYIASIEFTSSTWNTTTPSTGSMNDDNTKLWEGSANTVSFSWSSTARIESATVTLAETVTISSARFTTYVAKHNISFPAEVTAYIVTPKDESSVTLTAKASVPEGTAVVLEGDARTYALPTIETEPEDVTGNMLHASTGSTVGDGKTIYSLGNKSNGVGFYRVGEGVTVPAGKAYLIVGEGGSLSVKEFLSFDFEDVPTGLNDVRSKMDDVRGEIFNLAGQKINRLQKGINIVNGKKILVK